MNNTGKRKELIRVFGRKSMYQEARIDDIIRPLFGKSYEEYEKSHPFDEGRMMTMKTKIAYHHMQHISEEGDTSIENGALVTSLEHAFIHTLSRYEEEVVNSELRKYKENFLKWKKELSSRDRMDDEEEER